MTINIHKLIAAIVPEVYCQKYKDPTNPKEDLIKKIREIIKETKGDYLKASEIAVPVKSQFMDYEKEMNTNLMKAGALKNPIEKHDLTYEALGSSLEKIYFWLLDKANEIYKGKTIKLIDNFIASPGSAYFGELQARQTRMQEEGMKMLGAANQVIKSILNIIYDLKEFKIRLADYEKIHSDNPEIRKGALLTLKQIWMDTVDVKRGNTSIKGLALGGQAGFVTLIDAFLTAENVSKVKELDLNERVKRIIIQRLNEFEKWIKESESELRKRFELEKNYLRSQYNTVQIYSKWIKPYLKAAKSLEQTAEPTSSLVNAFNTNLFELAFLAYRDFDVVEDLLTPGAIPKALIKQATEKEYFETLIVEFKFRSIPERTQQQGGGYTFRGTVDVVFTSYALTINEIKLIQSELERDSFGDMLELISGATEESLGEFKEDIAEFLDEKKEDEESEKEKKPEDTNPFTALISPLIDIAKKKDKTKKFDKEEDNSKEIPKDNDIQKVVRAATSIAARERALGYYELYKSIHGMTNF